jgi:hypothetical protein
MKFIARHLNLVGLLLLASFATAAAGLYFDMPQKLRSKQTPATPTTIEHKGGCCADKAKAEPVQPLPAACPHLAAAVDSGCGSGCSH